MFDGDENPAPSAGVDAFMCLSDPVQRKFGVGGDGQGAGSRSLSEVGGRLPPLGELDGE